MQRGRWPRAGNYIYTTFMKDLTISSLPLQNLILECCWIGYTEMLIKLPEQPNSENSRLVRQKLLQLELLIPEIEQIIKNNET